jgi:hypothetical protein
MISDDDCDCLSIEFAGDRLRVWTDAGIQHAPLPLTPSDTAKVLGSLIAGRLPNSSPPSPACSSPTTKTTSIPIRESSCAATDAAAARERRSC